MSDLNKVQLIGRLGADPDIRQAKKEAPFIRFMKSYSKLCVNPDHLSAGSHAENMRQAAERRLMRSGKDHPQSIPVRVLGVEYDSQKSAERALNLGSGTVAYWLKNSPSKAQKLNASG